MRLASFDGMDAYYKAWLQYAFPIYVWVLVGAIIISFLALFRTLHSLHFAAATGTMDPILI